MTALERPPLPHDPAFRCAPWTRALGVDPIGSAPELDALVLVEWPLPWPQDVSEIPELSAATGVPGLRVMTVVPQSADRGDGLLRVVHRRRTGTNHLEGIDHQVARAELEDLLAILAADPGSPHLELYTALGASPPEVLVCAHGRRDACCGRWGTLLHVELAARWTDVRVSRCSHTGGHRFAPTAITLPDGRAWAYADADLLDRVVRRTGEVAHLAPHDRGTTGLDPWAQVVERAVLQHLGWSWLDAGPAVVATEVSPGGRAATVELTWDGGSAIGEVEITRDVPVLVCGQPPEQATKTSPDYALRSLRLG
jgi:hypothetical protein